jgi:hypothetical protein
VRVSNGVYEFVVNLGDKVYRAVLDCVAAVSHAVEWVFNKIKVGIQDLKRWLGFVFNWSDIVRTHKVIKNIVTTYAKHSIGRIGDLQNSVTESFGDLENQLSTWANIPAHSNEKAVGQIADKAESDIPSTRDPQTHYIHDKADTYLGQAISKVEKVVGDKIGEVKGTLEKLGQLATNEKEAVHKLIDDIKKEIIDKFSSLSPTEIVKRLAAIIGRAVIETAKNLITTTLGLVQDLGNAVLDGLNKPIQIPVLSWLYKNISDEELSILDLICLAAAVPATIIYKSVTGQNPFPDDSTTGDLIAAKDFDGVQNIMHADPSLSKKFIIFSEFAAMAGLLFDIITRSCKLPWMQKGEPHEVPDELKQVSVGVRLLIIMPTYLRGHAHDDAWYWKMETVVTHLAFLKTAVDASKVGEEGLYGTVSPYIDYGISAACLVPAIAKVVDNHTGKSSVYTALTTDLAFDIAVMVNPALWNPSLDPESKLILFATANAVLAVCSGVKVATGGLLHDGN